MLFIMSWSTSNRYIWVVRMWKIIKIHLRCTATKYRRQMIMDGHWQLDLLTDGLCMRLLQLTAAPRTLGVEVSCNSLLGNPTWKGNHLLQGFISLEYTPRSHCCHLENKKPVYFTFFFSVVQKLKSLYTNIWAPMWLKCFIQPQAKK